MDTKEGKGGGWDELEDWDLYIYTAAAAAKLLQSCPTPCDPRDGSPPGSPVPGILQARTLEWVAIAFSMVLATTDPDLPTSTLGQLSFVIYVSHFCDEHFVKVRCT